MLIVPGVDIDSVRLDGYFELYRHLHRHPEPSMQEFQTAALIERRLLAAGAETFVCGSTGVVGIVRNGTGPVVAFRADIDGLPIREETELPYASLDTTDRPDGTKVPLMHGCGHDSHITCALAAAELLALHRELWSGTLVFIFQPGEETASGSSAMVDDALWSRAPIPGVILGQHVGAFEAGTVQTRTGDVLSLADSWQVTVHGTGAHGSRPEVSIDPILTAAYVVTRLQSIVSREVDPLESVVVTVGTFHAGLKENIIPSEAVFTLNVRTPNDSVRTGVLAALRRMILAEAMAAGAPEPTITELYRFPRCYNDPDNTATVVAALTKALGAGHVNSSKPRSMASEDFGWLGDSIGVPTVFWWFGAHPIGQKAGAVALPGNHSPYFAPDIEPTIVTGIRSALAAILGYVGRSQGESDGS